MSIKITIGLILGFISFQSHSVELDGDKNNEDTLP